MLKALQELPILDRQLSVALIADRSSFQPLEHNFWQSMHNLTPDVVAAISHRHNRNGFHLAMATRGRRSTLLQNVPLTFFLQRPEHLIHRQSIEGK
jgi:hypothetical protein